MDCICCLRFFCFRLLSKALAGALQSGEKANQKINRNEGNQRCCARRIPPFLQPDFKVAVGVFAEMKFPGDGFAVHCYFRIVFSVESPEIRF